MGFVDVSSSDKQDLQTNKVLDHSHRIKTALILRSFDIANKAQSYLIPSTGS